MQSAGRKDKGLHKAKHAPLKNALLEYKDDKMVGQGLE
jgi:hypothetical protein